MVMGEKKSKADRRCRGGVSGPSPAGRRRAQGVTGPLCADPLSLQQDLLQRAISQSGVGLCPWAIQEDPLFWAKRVRGLYEGGSLPTFLSSGPCV